MEPVFLVTVLASPAMELVLLPVPHVPVQRYYTMVVVLLVILHVKHAMESLLLIV